MMQPYQPEGISTKGKEVRVLQYFVKTFSAFLCALASFLFGKCDGLLLALLSFICLDYISGVIVGATKHKLSSAVGFKGIAKKAFILIIVAVAHIIDSQVLGGQSSAFRSAICGIYIANEGLSILENAVKLGVPVPKQLKKFLEQLRDKGEEEST